MEINFHRLARHAERLSTAVKISVVVLLGSGLIIQSIGAWQDSQTTDEAVHLVSGYSYWRTGDFRLNPEHPPLIKLLASAPLLPLSNLNFSTTSRWWQESNQWLLGADFLYASGRQLEFSRLLMFLGRLPMIIIWAGLGWLLFSWAGQRWGPSGGLLSLSFFVFDPNFLGHGHLVTNDVAVSTSIAASVWAADRFFRHPGWSRWWPLGLFFALSQVTKFSALFLWILIPLLGLIRLCYRPTVFTVSWWWKMTAGLVLASAFVTWAAYGFEVKPLASDPGLEEDVAARLPAWAARLPIPAYSYWRGLRATAYHNYFGHESYLFGRSSEPDDRGWWYYFPVAIVLKMPIVTLLMIMTMFGFGAYRLLTFIRQGDRSPPGTGRRWWPTIPWSAWLLGLPPLLFLGWSMTSHINIGLRHVFPVYPFLYLGIGSLVTIRLGRWRWLLGLAVGWLGVTAVFAWPNTIGYFSGLFGGTTQGYRYLLDSNLDWNQDHWRLRDWLARERLGSVRMALFGSIPTQNFFPQAGPVLTDQDIAAGQRPTGIVVISVGQLWWPHTPFRWLQGLTPRWRVGSSILIYNFR